MTLQHFTIADLQRALHDGELSAREIARQTLDDIARVNPQINAWTEVTAQRMLAEADSIDALRREKRPLPPLAGIPYAVKNLFDVAGHTKQIAKPCPQACIWFGRGGGGRAGSFQPRQRHQRLDPCPRGNERQGC